MKLIIYKARVIYDPIYELFRVEAKDSFYGRWYRVDTFHYSSVKDSSYGTEEQALGYAKRKVDSLRSERVVYER